MNVSTENLGPCRKLMRIEVEAPEVDAKFQEVTDQVIRQVQLPGFRPGKAPRDMVTRMYEKDIASRVKEELINQHLKLGLKEEGPRALSILDVEELQFGRGQSLQFTATIESSPEFEIPEYQGLPIRRQSATVTDADLERALDVLRERQGNYQDVSRPIQFGDFAVVNYQGTCEGKPLTDFSPTAKSLTEQSNYWIQVLPGTFIPGFAEQLVGLQAGQRRSITVTFPADFVAPSLGGKLGQYEVEILQVKERVLPELSDSFAQTYGAENLEKLKEGVRADLAHELEFKRRRETREQIINSLLARTQFELPETLVTNETRNVVYNIVRENQDRGVSREIIEQQKDEIYSAAHRNARDRVKADLILQRIAEKENLQATEDEVKRRILFLAHQHQMKPEKLVKQLQERNGIAEIYDEIRASKALDLIEKQAQIEEYSPEEAAGS